MKNKRAFPTNEEIRQSVIHILRKTPNKELAASSIASMLIDRLVDPIKAEWGAVKSEMKAELEKVRENEKRLVEQTRRELAALEAKVRNELEAAEREDEDGEEWKRGKSRT